MKYISNLLAAFVLVTFISCADATSADPAQTVSAEPDKTAGGQEAVKDNDSEKDVVKVAVSSKDHTTLVTALQKADLVTALSNAGPFTVFAPTNEAFNMLPAGTVDNLVKPENKEKLSSILTFHVVAGRYTSKDLKDGMTLKTVIGKAIKITKKGNTWMVNGAKIVVPDVMDKNGVSFVIDTVLIP